jgi:hypothetical protein
VVVWIGFSWLRIGPSGGLMWMQWWTFRFWCHMVSYIFVCVCGWVSVCITYRYYLTTVLSSYHLFVPICHLTGVTVLNHMFWLYMIIIFIHRHKSLYCQLIYGNTIKIYKNQYNSG